MHEINAKGLHYRDLNEMVRAALAEGHTEITLTNVNGQYFIADGLRGKATITVEGVPGNDLSAFMDGPTVLVKANAQDNISNTMNSGKVVVHGHAGDVLGYGMRGGRLHVLGDVGYRVGIHMKGVKRQSPTIIAGGTAGDFFGEYLAGGTLILLGLDSKEGEPIVGDYIGTGMHGGVIYIRGEVIEKNCGAEVGVFETDEDDHKALRKELKGYCEDFGLDIEEVMGKPFRKLVPVSARPYGNLYAY